MIRPSVVNINKTYFNAEICVDNKSANDSMMPLRISLQVVGKPGVDVLAGVLEGPGTCGRAAKIGKFFTFI